MDAILQKLQKNITADDKAVLVMSVLFLVVFFARMIFALEALQFGRSVIKLYPLDIVLLGVYGGMLAKIFFGHMRFAWKQADVWLVGFFVLTTIYFGASIFGFGNNSLSV